jgi:hypothetical protein
MDSLISEVSVLWEHEFSDVPCLNQEIYVNALADTCPRRWKLLLSQAGTPWRISPFTKSEKSECIALDEAHYNITIDPQDGSICIDISEKYDGYISGLSLQCMDNPVAPVQVLAMQSDSSHAESWTVCYNSLDRQNALIKKLTVVIGASKHQERKYLSHFLNNLIEGQENLALAIYEKTESLRNSRSALQNLVARFHRQLNAHGMKRTFQFWSDAQKTSYLRGSQMMIDVLTQKFPDTCIGFGAVLGLERDADLIAHDDDIDILVAMKISSVKNLPNALSSVGTHLQRHGYKIEGVFFSHLWVRTTLGDRVDVFVGLIEDKGSLSFYPSARHSLQYGQVFPAEMADLYTLRLPFPRLRKEYLRQTYGDSWEQPSISFSHPWDRLSYEDLDAPRRIPAIKTRGEMARRVPVPH